MTIAPSVSSGRAYGKVILLGEHAVVYGTPGIVVGLERGARASVKPASGASTMRLGGVPTTADDTTQLGRAFAALLDAAPLPHPAIEVDVDVELPTASGLGSSASIAVAIAKALGQGEDHVSLRALAWERVFHGNPSGIDTEAARLGGVLRFRRDVGAERITGACDLRLAIGVSGATSSTKEMVELVARQFTERPKERERFCDAITALVQNAELALRAHDAAGLGRLMDLNHMLLAGLMLSTSEIEDLVRVARAEGALGAKVTGKGGGGAVVALVDPARGDAGAEAIVRAWERAGYRGFATGVSSRSVHPGV